MKTLVDSPWHSWREFPRLSSQPMKTSGTPKKGTFSSDWMMLQRNWKRVNLKWRMMLPSKTARQKTQCLCLMSVSPVTNLWDNTCWNTARTLCSRTWQRHNIKFLLNLWKLHPKWYNLSHETAPSFSWCHPHCSSQFCCQTQQGG